jgi:hypothetical protein
MGVAVGTQFFKIIIRPEFLKCWEGKFCRLYRWQSYTPLALIIIQFNSLF